MVDVERYMERITAAVVERFGPRVRYVGLQGSYARGEAKESSDVDVMLVLNELGVEDMLAYRAIVAQMRGEAPSCGFLCGARELAGWNTLEICQVLHETRDYYGRLAPLLPEFTREDVANYVKLGAGNLYHLLGHAYVHGTPALDEECLGGCLKQAFYMLQNLLFLRTGRYVAAKRELLDELKGEERRIMQMAAEEAALEAEGTEEAFRLLFGWCAGVLRSL